MHAATTRPLDPRRQVADVDDPTQVQIGEVGT